MMKVYALAVLAIALVCHCEWLTDWAVLPFVVIDR